MNKKIRAATIDIGTNTILMLIAEFDKSGKFDVLTDEHSIPRLGANLYANNLISEDSILRAKEVLIRYKKICNDFDVKIKYAVATSAIREAANGIYVAKILAGLIDTEINIIPGIEEARLSFIGTTKNHENALVIDIGGGSTEIINGINNRIINRISLDIGVVHLTNKFIAKHPPSESVLDNIRYEICKSLQSVPKFSNIENVYAVAGTPTTIAAVLQNLNDYQFDKIHGHELTINSIDQAIKIFLNHNIDEIINTYHVHPMRADVITVGAILLREILLHINISKCIVSAHGLRFGVMKELIRNYLIRFSK